MYGGSRVIGKTAIGENSFVSTGSILIDAGRYEPDSVLHGISPNARRSPTTRNVMRDVFGVSA